MVWPYLKIFCLNKDNFAGEEWSGDAMVLGKFPLPGRPANLDNSRARASALAVAAIGGVLTFLRSSILSIFLPLSGRRPGID